jgi:hypothetical protein
MKKKLQDIYDIVEREEFILNKNTKDEFVSKYIMLDILQEIKDILEKD